MERGREEEVQEAVGHQLWEEPLVCLELRKTRTERNRVRRGGVSRIIDLALGTAHDTAGGSLRYGSTSAELVESKTARDTAVSDSIGGKTT